MNNVDDILERLKGQQPMIDDPEALTERIMSNLPDFDEGIRQPDAQVVRMHWWMAVASLLLVIGIGTTLLFDTKAPFSEQTQLVETDMPMPGKNDTSRIYCEYEADIVAVRSPYTRSTTPSYKTKAVDVVPASTPSVRDKRDVAVEEKDVVVEESPCLHYAVCEQPKDTLPYQDPARVDEFIAKLADNYNVKQGELQCSVTLDSCVASAVYVFPDLKEIDVFGKLLQVACWYKSESPGYRLSFSNQQFFFELKDLRRQLQFRWIAERINGKILLYGTHTPLGTKESSACYQEYRDELSHIKSIHTKTKEI